MNTARMIVVTVDRKTWYRGKGDRGSRLRRPDGQQCCIGFLAKRLGATDHDILNMKTLLQLTNVKKDEPTVTGCATFMNGASNYLPAAYETNDRKLMTGKEREKELKELGKKMGVRFKFIN